MHYRITNLTLLNTRLNTPLGSSEEEFCSKLTHCDVVSSSDAPSVHRIYFSSIAPNSPHKHLMTSIQLVLPALNLTFDFALSYPILQFLNSTTDNTFPSVKHSPELSYYLFYIISLASDEYTCLVMSSLSPHFNRTLWRTILDSVDWLIKYVPFYYIITLTI